MLKASLDVVLPLFPPLSKVACISDCWPTASWIYFALLFGTSVSYSYHSLEDSPQSTPTRKLPLTLQIHWRCQLHSQAHVSRQSFMVLLHFCTSCKRGTSCTLFWIISSTMFVSQAAMEDRNGASFWSKGQGSSSVIQPTVCAGDIWFSLFCSVEFYA